MRRVEIWNVQGDHMIFENVVLAGPSEKERFFCVNRGEKMDYIPVVDIRRVTVTTRDPAQKSRGRNKR